MKHVRQPGAKIHRTRRPWNSFPVSNRKALKFFNQGRAMLRPFFIVQSPHRQPFKEDIMEDNFRLQGEQAGSEDSDPRGRA